MIDFLGQEVIIHISVVKVQTKYNSTSINNNKKIL